MTKEKPKMGLTKEEMKQYLALKEAIDFNDVFGVDDLIQEAYFSKRITEKQEQEIWNKLRKIYGEKRVNVVLQDVYDEW
jgi:hypothetical protein